MNPGVPREATSWMVYRSTSKSKAASAAHGTSTLTAFRGGIRRHRWVPGVLGPHEGAAVPAARREVKGAGDFQVLFSSFLWCLLLLIF